MNRTLALIGELKYQLQELGFTYPQIEGIVRDLAGTANLASLSPARLERLAKELDNYVWFSRRCRLMG
ncbi:MAG: hypothetical protein N2491_06325 [Negativicutes bacterium]|nr:hypothetical protein [Negativicutes bacterium]